MSAEDNLGQQFNPNLFDKTQRVSPQWIKENLRPTERGGHWSGAEQMVKDHEAFAPDHWGSFRESIRDHGVRRPVIVHNGEVLNGHHRVVVAAQEQRETVPVIVRQKARYS